MGRPRPISRPWSRTGENPPYGILGGDDGNVGIIRSPVRAIVLPDHQPDRPHTTRWKLATLVGEPGPFMHRRILHIVFSEETESCVCMAAFLRFFASRGAPENGRISTTAIGFMTSDPIPLSHKIGASLSMTIATVINFGLSRYPAPSIVASSMSRFVNSNRVAASVSCQLSARLMKWRLACRLVFRFGVVGNVFCLRFLLDFRGAFN